MTSPEMRNPLRNLPFRVGPDGIAEVLCQACGEGDAALVQSLLDAGVSANAANRDGWRPLARAVQQGHEDVVRILLERGADILARGPGQLQALHIAVTCVDTSITRILLDHDASNIEDAPTGGTPLHLAVSKGSEDLVSLLIEKGANPAAPVQPVPGVGSPGLGETALHMAVASWHDELIPFLLSKGLNVNARGENPEGQTPLHIAAWYGYADAAKNLLENGADINLPYANGVTALHKAAEHGRFEMVKFLLKHGADINASTIAGYTPLCAAAASSKGVPTSTMRITIETVLESAGPMSDSDKARVLWSAAAESNIDAVSLLVTKGFPMDAIHKSLTALDIAAHRGKEDMVIYFMEHWPTLPGPGSFPNAIAMAESSGHNRVAGLLSGAISLPKKIKDTGGDSAANMKIDVAAMSWALAGNSMIASRRRVLANINITSLPPIRCAVCYDLDFRRGAPKDAEIHHYVGSRSIESGAARGCPGCCMLRDSLRTLASKYGDRLSAWKRADKACTLISTVFGGPLLVSYTGPLNGQTRVRAEIFSAPGFSNIWPAVGIARDVPLTERSETRKAACRSFLNECLTKHRSCSANISSRLPSRVIDVGSENDQEPHLHISKAGEMGTYVSLSHCWGGSSPMTTTKDTMAERVDKMPLADLPQTFQDAIIITRDLGVRYLWIDSLCIIQDDQEDWEKEAVQMSNIYANCYVMIAASASATCSGGCFPLAKDGAAQASCPIPVEGPGGRRSHVLCRVTNTIDDDIGEVCHRLYDSRHEWNPCPLDQRGWTLQERILAPRILHFGQSEVGWECASFRACECQSVPTQLDTDSRWKSHLLNLPSDEGEHQNLSRSSPHPEKQWIWSNIVEEFTAKRSLTFHSDILPALAGLAKTMSSSAAEDYMCGLWKYKLPGFLMWAPATKEGRRHDHYYAPSWSWASIIGPIKFPAFEQEIFTDRSFNNREPYPISRGELGQSTGQREAELLEVIEFHFVPRSKSLGVFGPLRNAELIVHGPVAKARYEKRIDNYKNPLEALLSESGAQATASWDIPGEVTEGEKHLFLLFISEKSGFEEEKDIQAASTPIGRSNQRGAGLVLLVSEDGDRNDDAGPPFHRVGTFHYSGEQNWKSWKDERNQITLRLV